MQWGFLNKIVSKVNMKLNPEEYQINRPVLVSEPFNICELRSQRIITNKELASFKGSEKKQFDIKRELIRAITKKLEDEIIFTQIYQKETDSVIYKATIKYIKKESAE